MDADQDSVSKGVARRRPGSTGFNILSSVLKTEWVDFQSTLHCAFLFNEERLLKEKNLLLLEQILSFKSTSYFKKRSNEKFIKAALLVKIVERDRFIP